MSCVCVCVCVSCACALQDACKVVCYWVLRKYDIFQINSANLVNVRGAQTFNENPLARQSAGAVEVRLLVLGWLFVVSSTQLLYHYPPTSPLARYLLRDMRRGCLLVGMCLASTVGVLTGVFGQGLVTACSAGCGV